MRRKAQSREGDDMQWEKINQTKYGAGGRRGSELPGQGWEKSRLDSLSTREFNVPPDLNE